MEKKDVKRLFGNLVLAGPLFFSGAGLMTSLQPVMGRAVAAERAITLAVENLKDGCPSCAFIVERSLSRLDGVARVEVSTGRGTARVIYDDTVIDIATMTEATGAVGFPAHIVEE
jgi:periplasmic mercuric ion binding protein